MGQLHKVNQKMKTETFTQTKSSASTHINISEIPLGFHSQRPVRHNVCWTCEQYIPPPSVVVFVVVSRKRTEANLCQSRARETPKIHFTTWNGRRILYTSPITMGWCGGYQDRRRQRESCGKMCRDQRTVIDGMFHAFVWFYSKMIQRSFFVYIRIVPLCPFVDLGHQCAVCGDGPKRPEFHSVWEPYTVYGISLKFV